MLIPLLSKPFTQLFYISAWGSSSSTEWLSFACINFFNLVWWRCLRDM